ncbi:class I SAM-dependent methyltransferase [Paenibacillus woosongensis]|uniref:Methyltransferase domain-containing protein n=1 Tax=Paenibacillus woosongensis TaxID=307580 RepID=A0A7X2Z5E9_9BACL|nr:methyltransferase domain-containing protein [Paenibacillus woosongensis]MUG47842.1 methyltransferase domain-containing protein [Paenibacillus woosongensis]
MNNRWNKLIYRAGAPFYDVLFNAGPFARVRKKVFADLALEPGQRVLLVGVGTGADLRFFCGKTLEITAVDLSPAMLAQAKSKAGKNEHIRFLEMDAQDLRFADQSFDLVIASLILSVVPDEHKCMSELVRVTKERGSIVIFDKFKGGEGKMPLIMRMLRPLVAVLGTDIGRNYQAILKPHLEGLNIREDSPAMFGDMYRKIVLERK